MNEFEVGERIEIVGGVLLGRVLILATEDSQEPKLFKAITFTSYNLLLCKEFI